MKDSVHMYHAQIILQYVPWIIYMVLFCCGYIKGY